MAPWLKVIYQCVFTKFEKKSKVLFFVKTHQMSNKYVSKEFGKKSGVKVCLCDSSRVPSVNNVTYNSDKYFLL